jgi:hypothetical protein
MNGLEPGDALSPLLFDFTLEYAMAYADDVNILGGSIHTVKENAECLVPVTKEIGLEVNADKTNTRLFGERTAGLGHTMEVDNS